MVAVGAAALEGDTVVLLEATLLPSAGTVGTVALASPVGTVEALGTPATTGVVTDATGAPTLALTKVVTGELVSLGRPTEWSMDVRPGVEKVTEGGRLTTV